jgi:quinol-cytochrome oxidoreductase complex cytochrome b subunit
MALGDYIRNTQVWKSIFRHPAPRDRRNRIVVMLTNVFLHLHPVSVRKSGIALSYTWCMGGITFFLFLVETVTGVLLMFYYRPTLEHAYNDILSLRDVATLGILRELHRWGAHAMVISIWLHMYRVFLTGSYKPPREFNWGVGVILLVLTLLLSFTGYLLPWDQLAIWAITVGSNMARATPLLGYEGPGATFLGIPDAGGNWIPLIHSGSDARFLLLGGRFVGETALLRFYVLHCVAIPLAVALLIAVHFWRVRKDGGISGAL